ncbi:hypothetical protein [Paenibacillus senegalensis]|uniref:hypothetical protein n=1 Tax=Paenibacillus senegalensis TaxID=1465766 RepID=UPI0002891B8C|nr:hypothetical protein [Paenibacillus senegalensis]
MGANVGPNMANVGPMYVHSANMNPASVLSAGGGYPCGSNVGGYSCGAAVGGAGTSAGIILVLFILLVIILRAIHC